MSEPPASARFSLIQLTRPLTQAVLTRKQKREPKNINSRFCFDND
jgi:hypothetical protein